MQNRHSSRATGGRDASNLALWTTCRIVSDVVNGEIPKERYRSPATGAPDAGFFAGGEAQLDVFTARLRQRYRRGHRAASREDAMGFAVMMASGPAVAYRPDNRALTTKRVWELQADGEIMVGANGIFLRSDTMSGGWALGWSSIDQCEVVDLHTLVFATNRDHRIRRLRSPWSELAFALWAIRESPWNLQFTLGTWLPADWPQPPHLRIVGAPVPEADGRR